MTFPTKANSYAYSGSTNPQKIEYYLMTEPWGTVTWNNNNIYDHPEKFDSRWIDPPLY